MLSDSRRLSFTDAAGRPAADLGALLARCFARYRYPPPPDPERAMAERLASEDLELPLSVIALDGQAAEVGLSLLARRGEETWCGGFGLAVSVRGKGLARRLMDEQVARARAAGAALMRLEVLHGNDRALRTYLRTGFVIVRDVGLWRGDTAGGATGPGPAGRAGDAAERLAELAGVRHTWRRHPETLRRLALRPGVRGAVWPTAAAMWRPLPRGGTHLMGLAAVDETSAAAALIELLPHLGAPVTLLDEPLGTPVDAVLPTFGFVAFDAQHELELAL